MNDKNSKFHIILGISAFLIALCAAFFSVYGISTLFAGASISAMIMASSLEIGKLVGTTFLYRYWKKCNFLLKIYLFIAVLFLMCITSMGIFGYLSAAYQKSSIQFGISQDKISSLEQQKSYYQDKLSSSKKRIDELTKIRISQESRMDEVLTNEFLSRNPLQLKQLQQQTIDLISQTDNTVKEENTKIQSSIDDLHKLDEQISDIKIGTSTKKDVQTFKFVADALNLPMDMVVKWFILFIIFVFDPLAVGLVLAYNVCIFYKKENISIDKNDKYLSVIKDDLSKKTSINTITDTPVVSTTPVIDSIIKEENSNNNVNNKDDMNPWFKRMFKL